MKNLGAVCDQIKAVAQACDGTPTAKFIAVLIAAGVTDTKQIADILGIKVRAVQAAKKRTTVRAPQCASATECAQHSASAHQNASECAPECVSAHHSAPPARVEDNNLLTNLDTTVEDNTPLTPQKRKRAKPTVSSMAILQAFEAWNEMALRCNLPQAHALTPERRTKIGARLGEVGIEGWNRALANIERSAYLTGKNQNNWRADLKFFVRPDNFHKVHDGGYGNGRHAETRASAPIVWKPPTPEEMRAINA